jgi:hypothetical protein
MNVLEKVESPVLEELRIPVGRRVLKTRRCIARYLPGFVLVGTRVQFTGEPSRVAVLHIRSEVEVQDRERI